MKKFICLAKAFRGGEFFEEMATHIEPFIDGAVIMLPDRSWDNNGLENNCQKPAEEWAGARSTVKLVPTDGRRQELVYAQGLQVIRDTFGADSAILVIDSDETWPAEFLATLKQRIESNPGFHYFRSGIRTLIKSPLYMVWPNENCHPCVALQSAKEQPIFGRFQDRGAGRTMENDDIFFWHFPYCRKDESEITAKFFATGSQEKIPSDPEWLNTVWPNLPRGKNLHMTKTLSHCWSEIKVLPKAPCHLPPWCDDVILREEKHWQAMLESDPPSNTLIPTPNEHDRQMYGSIDPALDRRCKTTYLEAHLLKHLASKVPVNGYILEIGSGAGGSLAAMALGSHNSVTLIAVDPFTPYSETSAFGTVNGVMEGNEHEFWQTARDFRYVDRVRQIKHLSSEGVKQVKDGLCSLILVDGCHNFEFALQDIRDYYPKLTPGGLMLLHDWTTRFPGVIRAGKESGLPFSVFSGTSLGYCRRPL